MSTFNSNNSNTIIKLESLNNDDWLCNKNNQLDEKYQLIKCNDQLINKCSLQYTEWTEWSASSNCNRMCGNSLKQRNRTQLQKSQQSTFNNNQYLNQYQLCSSNNNSWTVCEPFITGLFL
jgi:hypothetical protein